MPSTEQSSPLSIVGAFPEFTFAEGNDFRWIPSKKTIEYVSDDPHVAERLLHEIGHAQLHHASYKRDIELIAIERDAWRHAKTVLAPLFGLTIGADVIEDDLDTYRDWLHARSTCPKCHATGIQTESQVYTCVACHTRWKVNTATNCGLKRYTQKTPQ